MCDTGGRAHKTTGGQCNHRPPFFKKRWFKKRGFNVPDYAAG
jgi:hypothetical protein